MFPHKNPVSLLFIYAHNMRKSPIHKDLVLLGQIKIDTCKFFNSFDRSYCRIAEERIPIICRPLKEKERFD